jgi:transposase
VQLTHEIKLRGYSGSDALAHMFVVSLRKQHRARSSSVPLSDRPAETISPAPMSCSSPKPRLSPTRASWLCVSQPKKLDEQQQEQVKQIQAAHPDFDAAYHLAQTFVSMLAHRQDTELDTWLTQAEQSGIAELKSFAQGIRRDYQAVRAAFTSEWSNGQVEGQVGRLKLQKRQMYGRANFDLLRVRVLHCA